ncbi:jg26506 [Pararge aegeria aegeria]|uniref:Jg26506 protein n=1 Tax=Pararge aegeria aegeria TaxID=348720 RepID=A0A8S4RYH7_9NEOP|nr:jg26506 [Pararge aegeria aegeria]
MFSLFSCNERSVSCTRGTRRINISRKQDLFLGGRNNFSINKYLFNVVSDCNLFVMACVEAPLTNADSEMEEGEIVDEADDLSDISSEEEFLLRQRLQVLENYNNVLERKEAKRSSIGPGTQRRAVYDYSGISGADADNGFAKLTLRITRDQKSFKTQQKQKRSKQVIKEGSKIKEQRRKNHRIKKKISVISDSETSDISEDEYRKKRRRLENAVSLSKVKQDTTTLKDRITKMLCGSKLEIPHTEVHTKIIESSEIPKDSFIQLHNKEKVNSINADKIQEISSSVPVLVCSDDTLIKPNEMLQNVIESSVIEEKADLHSDGNSDEDLELLRQLALKTKCVKLALPNEQMPSENKQALSEDEDSDTAELRMICLKSAFLKKAIEIKQKQKLQKRLSQSSIVPDDFDIHTENDINVDNNTDIESVDMDIGSDAEDKGKIINDCTQKNEIQTNSGECDKAISEKKILKDELEDDEDLLRAKLLTSLSKNLPHLVEINDEDSVLAKPETNSENTAKNQPQQQEKKFIIHLRESDSEGENEATKNLTKMHLKLSEQQEFQNKLDLFLKSTRMEVEKKKLPDVVQKPIQKPSEKLVIKAMNHLPKSEQIEYKNLVKRMAELEKLKQARQNAVDNRIPMLKETLKPRNISLEAYKIAYSKKIEYKIAQSRKKIAEESEKMLKLKEEATKLSQRYKIVATELRNIATAITINKKQQRVLQNSLFKIRHQHQMLIKSSPTKHSSSQHIQIDHSHDKIITWTKLQKENDPSKKEHKNPDMLKSVKVSVINNFNNENIQVHPRLSVQVDTSNNKKVVKMPKSPLKDRVVDIKMSSSQKTHVNELNSEQLVGTSIMEKETIRRSNDEAESYNTIQDVNDYKSPLDSLQCKTYAKKPRLYIHSNYRKAN